MGSVYVPAGEHRGLLGKKQTDFVFFQFVPGYVYAVCTIIFGNAAAWHKDFIRIQRSYYLNWYCWSSRQSGQELYCLFGICFATSNGFGINRAKLKRNDPSPPNIFNSKNFIFYSLFVFNYLGQKRPVVDRYSLCFLSICNRYCFSLG